MRAPLLDSNGTHARARPKRHTCIVSLSGWGEISTSAHKISIWEDQSGDTTTGKRESKSTRGTTLHSTCALGTFLCFEFGDHFGECHALSGIALPTSPDHLPHAIRELGVLRPIRQAAAQHRIHPRDDVPVGVRGFTTKNLKGPLQFNSMIRGCELYSYLPGYSGKGK